MEKQGRPLAPLLGGAGRARRMQCQQQTERTERTALLNPHSRPKSLSAFIAIISLSLQTRRQINNLSIPTKSFSITQTLAEVHLPSASPGCKLYNRAARPSIHRIHYGRPGTSYAISLLGQGRVFLGRRGMKLDGTKSGSEPVLIP